MEDCAACFIADEVGAGEDPYGGWVFLDWSGGWKSGGSGCEDGGGGLDVHCGGGELLTHLKSVPGASIGKEEEG